MSFRTALSGLNAAQTDLNVTGNNIANASTAGFKGSRTEFVDVYAVSFLGVSNTTAGSGVRVSSISQDFSQGNIEFTANNLDIAINGEGFFVLSDNGAGVYSRAGSFHLDRDGYVVNNQDARMQVYPATGNGTFDTGVLQDLQLQTSEGAPNATSAIEVGVNLDAGDDEPAVAFNATDPDTYNNSSSLVVYDSLGTSHTATMYFRKDETTPPGVNLWNAYLYVDGTVVTSGGASPIALAYNSDGSLATGMPITYDAIVTTTGSLPINLAIDYGDSTQFGSPFSVNVLSQDGFATGRLTGINIDTTGIVSARYTNGQSTILGKIALASFANPQGLNQLGDTSWGETFTSGDRVLGEAGTATFGVLQSGALEASNVDVAEQLVGLITAQRNYQANAQVISTEDQVTQTIINIR
jgi:flagellar hook protein FlgE